MLFRNVFVYKRGSVFDENGNYIPEASCNFNKWNKVMRLSPHINHPSIDSLEKECKRKIKRCKYKKSKKENYVYGFSYFHQYPFGHIFDILQPLKEVEELGEFKRKICLNNRLEKIYIKNFKIHLELFGYGEKCIEIFDIEKNPVFFHNLYSPYTKEFLGMLDSDKVGWIISKYKNLFPKKDEECKLYLYRSQNKYTIIQKRKVLNEDEVMDFMKSKGFICVDGSEPLEHIIKLFSGAKFIVGAHSSCFMNMIFCRNNPEVHEFCPDNRVNMTFMNMGNSVRLTNHYQLLVPADKDNSIVIPMDYLESLNY